MGVASRTMRAGASIFRQAWMWGGGVAGVLLFAGGLSLTWTRSRIARFVETSMNHQVTLAARMVSVLSPVDRPAFLEWLVRTEAAVYAAVLENDSVVVHATAFPGFLPVRKNPVPGKIYRRDLPIGEVREIYLPLPAGQMLLYGFPYFEVASWMRPLWLQNLLALFLVSLLAGAGTAGFQLWRASRWEARLREARMREKLELLREVAHELKSPLVVVSMGLQHLLRESLPAHRRQDIQELRRQVEALVGLIQTALERTPPEIAVQPIHAASLVEEILGSLDPLVQEKNLKVHTRVAVSTLHADPFWIRQGLRNLIQNAVEASPPGGTLWITLHREGHGVAILVEDEGPGIPEGTEELAFHPGWSTRPGGSGLGLPLVRRVARLHGGEASLLPRPGGGTRARLWIPQKEEGRET